LINDTIGFSPFQITPNEKKNNVGIISVNILFLISIKLTGEFALYAKSPAIKKNKGRLKVINTDTISVAYPPKLKEVFIICSNTIVNIIKPLNASI
jgi:hypothetical protein